MSTNLYRAIVRSPAHLHPTEQDRGQFFYDVVSTHMHTCSRIALALLFAAAGAAGAAYADPDPADEAAMATLGELVGCMQTFDADCVQNRTYTKFFERNGVNPEKGGRALRDLYSKLKSSGTAYSAFQLGASQKQEPQGRIRYVIVPYSFELESRGHRISQEAFFIGVSEDEGLSWKFLDGISSTQDNIRKVIPNYSGEPLPDRRIKPIDG